jgi:hypothetical protein
VNTSIEVFTSIFRKVFFLVPKLCLGTLWAPSSAWQTILVPKRELGNQKKCRVGTAHQFFLCAT